MADQNFIARRAGKNKSRPFMLASTGAPDANRPVMTGPDGKLDPSVMPAGVGAATIAATTSEAIGAGKYVNFHNNAGVYSARLADNSNDRPAEAFALAAFGSAVAGVFYPLDSFNTALTGLTIGAEYWLGTAGGVISTPLDEVTEQGSNKISQYIGKAKSATELVTEDSPPVYL